MKGAFAMDPKVREENIKRKKMKSMLKELRKPVYKQQLEKLHPSLKQDIEDENIKILEALLEAAEEKYYKAPDMILSGQQASRRSQQLNNN